MQFDELVDIYLEEFNSEVKRLGFGVNVSNNGPYRKGKTPDGFKGDIGRQNSEIVVGDLFPQKENKKIYKFKRK